MIRINDLHFSYPGSRHRVFDGLNLSLESDSIYGLLGKNGEGKSTLLYLLSGLLRAPRGEVKFLGMDMKERRAEALQEIFIVPEEYDLPRMTMKQFIELNRRFYPRFSEEVLRGCLRDFEMPEVVDLKSLSMGQKKKVYMTFALAANTRLLLMDEPTNGLDIPSKSLFRKAVANSMCEDRIIIISTHQVHDVEALLDHVLILDEGHLKFDGSTAAITEKYSFELRQPSEMTPDVVYAEPTLQGNAVIAPRREGSEETQLNLELFFNAVTRNLIKQ